MFIKLCSPHSRYIYCSYRHYYYYFLFLNNFSICTYSMIYLFMLLNFENFKVEIFEFALPIMKTQNGKLLCKKTNWWNTVRESVHIKQFIYRLLIECLRNCVESNFLFRLEEKHTIFCVADLANKHRNQG
jgi:hypothetical protein